MNYYEILEVSPNASAAVIRAAYKSLIQRYHPDKNPDDAAVAERASLVVQAYEVLSDSGKRSAYDLELKARSEVRPSFHRGDARAAKPAGARAGKAAARENRHFWFLCLIIAAIILSAWSMMSVLKKNVPPQPTPKLPSSVEIQSKLPETAVEVPPVKAAPEKAKSPDANAIPAFISSLAVNLKSPDKPSDDTGRVLYIPVLSVKVGARDAESALRHLNNTTELIKQKLQDNLALAKYDELIKPDGEQYLAKIILDTIKEATGTADAPTTAPSDTGSAERYGPVEVLLPASYSVK